MNTNSISWLIPQMELQKSPVGVREELKGFFPKLLNTTRAEAFNYKSPELYNKSSKQRESRM